ncbi:hypothetical protein GCM10012284_43710 [Mangrovihabitans endophyticus]|uniref:Uncharacterized protein n=2 Tax=Mangrovihabitans endophyticus TaxID=1751298 RepID=A0A8J3C451_9ACTN|nr:hypothetical protein GCM10012284_43710 [Mangrovihabitans endophyticus]
MSPGERAAFIAAYSKLVADVWADPAAEQALADDPRALLAEHGLRLPIDVPVTVGRDAQDAQPDLDAQATAWTRAAPAAARAAALAEPSCHRFVAANPVERHERCQPGPGPCPPEKDGPNFLCSGGKPLSILRKENR